MVTIRGRRIPLAPLILLAALAAYGAARYAAERGVVTGAIIEGSGSIEATQVHIAAKIPGRVLDVLADSGDTVAAGAVLVRLDAREMDAQLAQAEAAVFVARARLAQAEVALRAQRRQSSATIDQAEAAESAARARVPQAQEAVELQQAQSEQQRAQAEAAVSQAEAVLAAATANRAAVRANLRKAEGDLTRASALFREGAVAAQAVDAARAAVDALAAQDAAAAAQEVAARQQVEQARAALELARAGARQVAIRRQDVAVAQAQQAQAQAASTGARTARDLVAQREQEVAVALAALAQAEAAVRYFQAVRSNAILTSPIDGVVLSRAVEPGEIVGAGVPILTVADLRTVWMRVYVPEAHLGRLRVGQRGEVYVDAFPGRAFPGRVSEIAGQAEFTPRNVTTRVERAKLVFAVRLTLENPQGLLKPGMPSDARIFTAAPAP